jgi:hypothetical protein
MPEKINLKVGPSVKRNVPNVTFESFLRWLEGQGYSEEIKQRLIAKARTYPTGALTHFMKNIQSHLEF